ncbi:MAG TPA: carboxypeptidase regulatory-like domain-containing protein [Gemmatimonas sp.]|nr:carboxypeptidase regulatory-like domain-containing protein [Gemmatimonas sp.]
MRLSRSWLDVVLLAAGVTGSLLFPHDGGAQPNGRSVVRGTVVNSAGVPVEGAYVAVSGTAFVTETNDAGEFLFPAIDAGARMLRVRRLGFRPDSVAVTATAGRNASVVVTLQPVAVQLTAVEVRGRPELTGPMGGFYRRRSIGTGRYFTAEDIDRRNPSRLTDLLRGVPGLAVANRVQGNVRIRGSRCAPVIFFDGQALSSVEFDLDAVDPRSFEGIEVYSGSASVPVEFQRTFRVSSSCGTIMLWSKRGQVRPKTVKPRDVTPSALVARMLEQRTALAASDVDTVARVDSTRLVLPVYPTSLYESAIAGRVLAEFVVAANGTVDMGTFSAVTATHRAFVEPVRLALDQQRFRAAFRGGVPVNQVMQLPFDFLPDSSLVERKKRR